MEVEVFEKGPRPLAKVALTGGGRCNLTNSFRDVKSLTQVYPRGERLMKQLLKEWGHRETMQWFEERGVSLVIQKDECVFPRSQNAMQVVATLLTAMQQNGVKLTLRHRLTDIHPEEKGFRLSFETPEGTTEQCFEQVVVTTGGAPRPAQLNFLRHLQLNYEPPVPSLFTLRIDCPPLLALTGTVIREAEVMLTGTHFRADGALLITHRGVSGPAILRLSSHAARHLAECNYKTTLCINWLGKTREEEARQMLETMRSQSPKKQMGTIAPPPLTSRHWIMLLKRSDTDPQMVWADLNGKRLSRLACMLTADTYRIEGRDRHKEEFVTCGGVALNSIDTRSLEAREHKGLYFAGEVLDVDAVTGGFNLQAAWTMGHTVAAHIQRTTECSI